MKPSKRSSPDKPHRSHIEEFLALSDDEKERIWESFNREISPGEFRPLNAEERALWSRGKQKLQRPARGSGNKVISVRVALPLLRRADAFAMRRGITRAALVTAGLRAVLKRPALLDQIGQRG